MAGTRPASGFNFEDRYLGGRSHAKLLVSQFPEITMNRLTALLGVMLTLVAAPAHAALRTITFEIHNGSWEQISGTRPFGLEEDFELSGWLVYDDQIKAPPAMRNITDLHFITGSKSWSVSDLVGNSMVYALYGDSTQKHGFSLDFDPERKGIYIVYNNESNNNMVTITDGINSVECWRCITAEIPVVPEPATWAMMIVGLGFAGAGLRVHRAHKVQADNLLRA